MCRSDLFQQLNVGKRSLNVTVASTAKLVATGRLNELLGILLSVSDIIKRFYDGFSDIKIHFHD